MVDETHQDVPVYNPAPVPNPDAEPTQSPLEVAEELLADLQHRVRTNSGINDYVMKTMQKLVDLLKGKD